MFEQLYYIWAQWFNKMDEKEKDKGYFILQASVALTLLPELYERFVREGIEPIEQLTQNKKERLWQLACKHQTEKEKRLRAVKSAYVLQLMCNAE